MAVLTGVIGSTTAATITPSTIDANFANPVDAVRFSIETSGISATYFDNVAFTEVASVPLPAGVFKESYADYPADRL